MDMGDLEKRFRSEVDDEVAPFLWTQADFRSYLNATIDDACERALLIEDEITPEVVRINVKPDKHTYQLHPSIICIERAKLDSQSHPLQFTDRATLDRARNWDSLTGTPTRIMDLGATCRLVRIPTVADVLRLVVKRRPLSALTENSQCPEIPEPYHIRLIPGVIARAFKKRDTDTYKSDESESAEIEFTKTFGAKRDVNVMRKQREKGSHTTRCSW